MRRLALTKQTTEPDIENVKELSMEHMIFRNYLKQHIAHKKLFIISALSLLGTGIGFGFLAFVFEFISFKLL